jgi:hypothetical protein
MPRVLVSICRSPPLQHFARGRPVLIQLARSAPRPAQCVLPPLMGFGFPSAFLIARSVQSALECTSSSLRAGPPGPADCAFAVSTTLTFCSTFDLAESTSHSAPLLGFFAHGPRDDELRVICARPPLLPPLAPARGLGSRVTFARVLATNAVPFAHASPSNNNRPPSPPAGPRPSPSPGSVPAGRDELFARLLPRASSPARLESRSINAIDRRPSAREGAAPRSFHAPTGRLRL